MGHGLDKDKLLAQNEKAEYKIRARKPSGCRCGCHGNHHAHRRVQGKFRKFRQWVIRKKRDWET